MKKKYLWIALLALLVVSGTYGMTLAFFTDTKEQENVFVMGKVGIQLKEPEFEKATNGTYLIEDILPNQTIIKDPQINVDSDSLDVYVRANIQYEGLSEQETTQLEANINFANGWDKGEDGNYYYNSIATKGEVVPIFHSVVIPWEWGNEILSREFKIIVNAEAIQADYFTPETRSVNGVKQVLSWKNKNGTLVSVK